MHPLYQRMAELYFKKRFAGGITEEEEKELELTVEAHTRKAMKLGRLYNLSYVAYTTEDYDWLHEICAEIDAIKEELFDYM
ncbi:DUF7667 family protein [Tuberibacillus sp. Marseille-P3662]|uniref:DUF7667 family protein n=1 Tax=Tuberibacillus sp. Marseille-P3662 TaxID=1965358 RepID=UPI000A1C9F09|nr:hypothetical protein [Tuberibacillus sp. Marseille-P3662]